MHGVTAEPTRHCDVSCNLLATVVFVPVIAHAGSRSTWEHVDVLGSHGSRCFSWTDLFNRLLQCRRTQAERANTNNCRIGET
jgi:hypothetical protein